MNKPSTQNEEYTYFYPPTYVNTTESPLCPICGITSFAHRHKAGSKPKDFERLPEASKTKDRALQEDMTKAIKHAGKYMKKEQDKIMPPDEYCPECMSLKRKPNKDCVNHDSYWLKPVSATGGTLTIKYLEKTFRRIQRAELKDHVDSMSSLMVKNIANKHIVVQDTHEGKIHQRHWYLVAQKMLKKLVKEYKKECEESYRGVSKGV